MVCVFFLVFNSLIQTCLKNVLGVIQNHLGIDPAKSAKARYERSIMEMQVYKCSFCQ